MLVCEGIEYWFLSTGSPSYEVPPLLSCLYLWMEPKANKNGARSPQNIINLIPALYPNIELNHPYINGAGRYPNTFLIIYPFELPNALRYGGTETIISPVSPGIIAPPKIKQSTTK